MTKETHTTTGQSAVVSVPANQDVKYYVDFNGATATVQLQEYHPDSGDWIPASPTFTSLDEIQVGAARGTVGNRYRLNISNITGTIYTYLYAG
jgi:hypothetical protein